MKMAKHSITVTMPHSSLGTHSQDIDEIPMGYHIHVG